MRHKISYADLDHFQSTVCSSYKVYKMLRHVALMNIYLNAVTNSKTNGLFYSKYTSTTSYRHTIVVFLGSICCSNTLILINILSELVCSQGFEVQLFKRR